MAKISAFTASTALASGSFIPFVEKQGDGTFKNRKVATDQIPLRDATGKNLWDKSTAVPGYRFSPATNTIVADATYRSTGFIYVGAGVTVTVSGVETTRNVAAFATNDVTAVGVNLAATNAGLATVTMPAGKPWLWVNITDDGAAATTYDGAVQVEVAPAATSYEAYKRVISRAQVEHGPDFPVMVAATGKNLIDVSKVNFVKRVSVSVLAIQADTVGIACTDWIPVKAGQSYILSGAGVYAGSSTYQGCFFPSYGVNAAVSALQFIAPVSGQGQLFVAPADGFVVLNLKKAGSAVAATTLDGTAQLEAGEIATAYEVFQARRIIPNDNLPYQLVALMTGSAASAGSGVLNDTAWYTYVEGEPQPTNRDKLPKFVGHQLRKDKDYCIAVTGTSLTSRSDEMTTPRANPQNRPPLAHANNLFSLIVDKVMWDGQKYSRYDDAAIITEMVGAWATSATLPEWDDATYRSSFTRYSATAGAKVKMTVPIGAWQWNMIYRTDSAASSQVSVAIDLGNGKMQVFDVASQTWVEANGYIFSMVESAPVASNIAVPDPSSGATNTISIQTKSNTTYQKRLKFRCKGDAVDSRTAVKAVTFTAVAAGRFNYWGCEWSPRQYMITVINAARGSHNTDASTVRGLPKFQDNELWGFKPDLVYFELPIHNDGASNAAAYAAGQWERLTNNYVFNTDYALSMKSRSQALNGYVPEIGMWTPTICYGFGGIAEDGTLIAGQQNDGSMMTALDKFAQAVAWVRQNHPEVVCVHAVQRWVDACKALYNGDMKAATQASSRTGPSLSNDGDHPNDIGTKVLAKPVLGPLSLIE